MDVSFKNLIDRYSTNHNFKENTILEIGKYISLLELKKKHILIKENQRHDFAYFLIKGAVRSFYIKDGVEVNTWFAFEQDMVGSLRTFNNMTSRETIELVENATLIAINLKKLKPLIYNNIEIANFISNVIEEYALFLEDKLYYTQMVSSLDRYNLLLENNPKLFKRIPLTHIASYLGISRETLSRLRAK